MVAELVGFGRCWVYTKHLLTHGMCIARSQAPRVNMVKSKMVNQTWHQQLCHELKLNGTFDYIPSGYL